jgi:glycosyltransferase involved in cell wall biosynthesis
MVNYINLSFDYDSISEKDWLPYISNDAVSPWWTWRIELLDDMFFHTHWSCVTVIAGSWKNDTSLIFWDGSFSVQRTHHLEKEFYKNFWMAKTLEECQSAWLFYNNKLFDFALKSLDKLAKYRKWLNLESIIYDFIHTPSSWLTLWAAKKLSAYLWLPLVSTIHVDEKQIQILKGNQYPWADFILQKDAEIKKESDLLIVKNNSLYDSCIKLNPNCIQIGNDLHFPLYNTKILWEKDYKQILYVWRVSYEKWFDRFAKIVEHINSIPNDYKFVICWEIWDNGNNSIAEYIHALKKHKNVSFEGHVGRVAIQDVFLESWTFILPSRTETYNQTIMEALFYGCNVICTDVWAAQEQIGDCECSFVLQNDDSFVSNTLQALSNMNYGYQKSKLANQYANQKFNSDICRKKKMELLISYFK